MSTETQSINSATNSTEFPIYPSQCARLTPVSQSDVAGYWGNRKIFYQVIVETEGNVVIEMKDGSIYYRPGLSPGEILVVGGGRRILSSANALSGSGGTIAVSTSATGIWVYGGK